MSKERTITVGPVRLSYEHLWGPAAIGDSDNEKYSGSFIIDKKNKKALTLVNDAVEAAIEEGITTKWGGKKPKNLKLPLRDGDEDREDVAYENSMFFNASANRQPQIVDRKKQPILSKEEVYSGCYGYVCVTFYPFDAAGNKGVAAGLNIFMKTKDGEPLASTISVDEAFEGIEIEDDEDDDLFD